MTPERATDPRLVAPRWALWWGLATAAFGVLIAVHSNGELGAAVVLVTGVVTAVMWSAAVLTHALRIRRRNEPLSLARTVTGWVGGLAAVAALLLTAGVHPKEMLVAQLFNGAAIALASDALMRRHRRIQFAQTPAGHVPLQHDNPGDAEDSPVARTAVVGREEAPTCLRG